MAGACQSGTLLRTGVPHCVTYYPVGTLDSAPPWAPNTTVMSSSQRPLCWPVALLPGILTLLVLASGCHPPVRMIYSCGGLACKVSQWHKQRVARLTARTGWLALAGLFWLKPGDNLLGGNSQNHMVWPDGAPKRVGNVTLVGGKAHFLPSWSTRATCNGKPVSRMEGVPLRPDLDRVFLGRFTFLVIERGGRLALRLYDSESPTRRSFRGIETFAVSEKWRVKARFVAHQSPREVEVSTVINTTEKGTVPGVVRFTMEGKEHQLSPLSFPGSSQLFFNFADATNSKQTYGGGRFLYADAPKDGVVVLDFNRAYNPPCSFTPYGTCPVPLDENRLSLAVTAGEKKYAR